MRQYDYHAAQRVDYFIANSKETQKRISKFYRRESTVIYPPIDTRHAQFTNVQRGTQDYYLFVSRPVGSKGLELAVAASKKLGIKLKIVGRSGMNTEHIEYFGIVTDEALFALYSGAKAFLALATNEDFGMTPVEAMSCGTPVIAYNGGGYAESVIDGKTGILFNTATDEGLIGAIRQFEKLKKDWSKDCINQAKKFSIARFKREIKQVVTANAV
jgi:glycosyltransferase involved in cell wall biosynthesis